MVIKETDPMGNTETYSSYDYAGNLLVMTDRNSNTQRNIYGAFGLTKTYFDGSPETKEYTYNSLGQLTGTKAVNADESEVSESYSYDPFGRVKSKTSNDGSVQSYGYDLNSNLISYVLEKDGEEKKSIEYGYSNMNV